MARDKLLCGKIERGSFVALPERAQELFFDYMISHVKDEFNAYRLFDIKGLNYEHCESPIEVLFNFAFDIADFERTKNIYTYYLLPQMSIQTPNGNYRADFLFSTNEMESPYMSFEEEYFLIIECDGHDFHEKTKEQVKRRNERDMDLKNAGYDILHFSGSQIYNDPMKCAFDAWDYINSHVKVIRHE